MNQDKGTDLPTEDSTPIDGHSKAPTPVPTTILEALTFEVLRWKYGASSAETKAEIYKAKEALETYYNTKYTTRLKKCIGEYTEYTPPESIQDHWSLTESAIIRQMENIKNLGRQELRAEILKNWEAEK